VSVYVDDAFLCGDWGRWTGGGHLQADTTSELHAFAAQLGLRREWFQRKPGRPDRDHYDLTRSARDQAIRLGAVPETMREGVERRRAVRHAREPPAAPAHRPGRGQRSDRCGEAPPARLRQGIEEFNGGLFFEQHETLEAAWLEEADPVRYLYQGILQVGVGFEHLRRGNAYGARRLWRRGIGYLEPFRQGCLGVDVQRLVTDTHRCLAELERVGDDGLERFDRSLIPRVRWLA
jgi:predicted metal-dependent hydrolase